MLKTLTVRHMGKNFQYTNMKETQTLTREGSFILSWIGFMVYGNAAVMSVHTVSVGMYTCNFFVEHS